MMGKIVMIILTVVIVYGGLWAVSSGYEGVLNTTGDILWYIAIGLFFLMILSWVCVGIQSLSRFLGLTNTKTK